MRRTVCAGFALVALLAGFWLEHRPLWALGTSSLDTLRDELVRVLPAPRATLYSDLAEAGETSPATAPLAWLARANAFPNYISFQDVKPLLARMRMVKDAGEVERIRRANEASVAAHLVALGMISPGVSEHAVAALMQYEFEKRGCERASSARWRRDREGLRVSAEFRAHQNRTRPAR